MSVSPGRITNVKVSKPVSRTPEKFPWPRNSTDEPLVPLGVDVVEKKQDIIKIVYKFFRVESITMEELLQEVFLAIIHKNQTRSAHDPRKSSFGHYVYMVANNVCINLVHKKKKFDREQDFLDAPCGDDTSRTNLDIIEDRGFLSQVPTFNEPDFSLEFEDFLWNNGMRNLARYIRATRSGARAEVIRRALSWGECTYSTKMIRDLRAQVKDAVQEMSLEIA